MKPLTKEEREQIARAMATGHQSAFDICADEFFEKVLAAEAYWREQSREMRTLINDVLYAHMGGSLHPDATGSKILDKLRKFADV